MENKNMRIYHVTVWDGEDVIEYAIDLSESEKANKKTFKEKISLKYWHTIIAWSLVEE